MKSVPHTLVQLTTNAHGLPCRTLLSDHESLGKANEEKERVLRKKPEAVVEVVKSAEWHGWS